MHVHVLRISCGRAILAYAPPPTAANFSLPSNRSCNSGQGQPRWRNTGDDHSSSRSCIVKQTHLNHLVQWSRSLADAFRVHPYPGRVCGWHLSRPRLFILVSSNTHYLPHEPLDGILYHCSELTSSRTQQRTTMYKDNRGVPNSS